jgi:S-DNA-T family DNA segregation ATPase FtsK/SpoIIIE
MVFVLCLQSSFLTTLKTLQYHFENIGNVLWKAVGKIINRFKNSKIKQNGKNQKINFQKKAIDFIKDGSNKIKEEKKIVSSSSKDENHSEIYSADEKRSITPIISNTNNNLEATPVLENEVAIVKGIDDKVIIQEIKGRRVPAPKAFFKSKDLVDCINIENKIISNKSEDSQYFTEIMSAIEDKLQEFKISAKIINVLKGPVVDTFEMELGEGVKLSKVLGLSDDLGLALSGVPIRIVYPLRGRSTIGIEVPRNPREIIYLDDVLKTKEFAKTQHRLPVAMGKDAFGEVKFVDLASMPHMLVAGATGAGKSVFINTMLVSLIVKLSPRDLKLVLIDPKQLELATYERLPHLLMPVVTDAKIASIAMLWLVQEMERRYSILKNMGGKIILIVLIIVKT